MILLIRSKVSITRAMFHGWMNSKLMWGQSAFQHQNQQKGDTMQYLVALWICGHHQAGNGWDPQVTLILSPQTHKLLGH